MQECWASLNSKSWLHPKESSRTLPKWTFAWLASTYPGTGVVIFWNVSEWCHVSECVSCSGLTSLELKIQYILVYLLIAGHGASWLPWNHGLDPGKSCASGEETCLMTCILCEKMTKWVWHSHICPDMWHSQLFTYVLQDLLHSRLAPYNCLLSYLVWRFDCNLAWNTCPDWKCCWCISMQLFIVFDWECGFSLLFNLRPSGANRSSASKARATTGKRMWRRVTLTCEEICLGWMACGSCWDGQMSTSRTSRPSPRSTSTDTFVSSRMPTLRGVLAALDSFSHCAKIWIWNLTSLFEKINLSTLQMEQTVV